MHPKSFPAAGTGNKKAERGMSHRLRNVTKFSGPCRRQVGLSGEQTLRPGLQEGAFWEAFLRPAPIPEAEAMQEAVFFFLIFFLTFIYY